MREQPSRNLCGLDLDLARRIDEVCRRFEADWRAGRRPRIEDYGADIPEEGRAALQAELEAVERELGRSEETVAPPESGAAPAAESKAAPLAAGAVAATVPPGAPPTVPLPGAAPGAVHHHATPLPEREAAVDLPRSPPDLSTFVGLGERAPSRDLPEAAWASSTTPGR
jgi:hypothetical protein